MSRFIEVTRLYNGMDKNGWPKKPIERIEVDLFINADFIVSFRSLGNKGCEIVTTNEVFEVTQTYEFIHSLISPPISLGPIRG